jgi:mRNA-degrading endonuclease YafQ of YafQ-DinJ toxin-antitoxin module
MVPSIPKYLRFMVLKGLTFLFSRIRYTLNPIEKSASLKDYLNLNKRRSLSDNGPLNDKPPLREMRHKVFHNCMISQDCRLIFKIVKRYDLLCFNIRSLAVDAILYSSQPALEDLIKNMPWNGLKCQLNPVN